MTAWIKTVALTGLLAATQAATAAVDPVERYPVTAPTISTATAVIHSGPAPAAGLNCIPPPAGPVPGGLPAANLPLMQRAVDGPVHRIAPAVAPWNGPAPDPREGIFRAFRNAPAPAR
jgi:hypothetical protein